MEPTKFETTIKSKLAVEYVDDGVTIDILASTFPSGERNIRIDEQTLLKKCEIISITDQPRIVFIPVIENTTDLVDFQIISHKLEELELSSLVTVIFKYLPYGRADRHFTQGDIVGSNFMANIINQYNFNTVCVVDPHSENAVSSINNVEIMSIDDSYEAALSVSTGKMILNGPLVIVAPDAGATHRAELIANFYKLRGKSSIVIQCIKHRSAMNEIETLVLDETTFLPNDSNFLVVDDICDGGATFVKVAEAILAQHKPKSLNLFVSTFIQGSAMEKLKNAGYNDVLAFNSFESVLDVLTSPSNQYNLNNKG
jgi:ribose-phosphate pyrophosphokinase